MPGPGGPAVPGKVLGPQGWWGSSGALPPPAVLGYSREVTVPLVAQSRMAGGSQSSSCPVPSASLSSSTWGCLSSPWALVCHAAVCPAQVSPVEGAEMGPRLLV